MQFQLWYRGSWWPQQVPRQETWASKGIRSLWFWNWNHSRSGQNPNQLGACQGHRLTIRRRTRNRNRQQPRWRPDNTSNQLWNGAECLGLSTTFPCFLWFYHCIWPPIHQSIFSHCQLQLTSFLSYLDLGGGSPPHILNTGLKKLNYIDLNGKNF